MQSEKRQNDLCFQDWCWSWNSNTLATSWEELTHWKRPWCWEGLGTGGEGDNRGWDGRMASLTRWTWVWVNSGSWWWTGRSGMLWFVGSQRVGPDWATKLNWSLRYSICQMIMDTPLPSLQDCVENQIRPCQLIPLQLYSNEKHFNWYLFF